MSSAKGDVGDPCGLVKFMLIVIHISIENVLVCIKLTSYTNSMHTL